METLCHLFHLHFLLDYLNLKFLHPVIDFLEKLLSLLWIHLAIILAVKYSILLQKLVFALLLFGWIFHGFKVLGDLFQLSKDSALGLTRLSACSDGGKWPSTTALLSVVITLLVAVHRKLDKHVGLIRGSLNALGIDHVVLGLLLLRLRQQVFLTGLSHVLEPDHLWILGLSSSRHLPVILLEVL